MNVMKTLSMAGLITLTALTAACSTSQYTDKFSPITMRNPITVAESVERLELYTRPDGLELSARDKLAVAQFLDGYRHSGSGPLYINRPSAQAGSAGTQQAEAVIRDLMRNSGLNPAALQGGQYQSVPDAPAPVVVSYRVLQAIPDNCRRRSSVIHTYNNQAPEDFGCFQSANIAAMISDPRQLLEPYTFGSPDAQRRQVVYDRYIQGQQTGAEFPARQRAEQAGN